MDIYLLILLICFSIIIGIDIGLMGQSGSVVIIPFLFSFFGFTMLKAMGTSIVVDFLCAAIAIAIYLIHRKDNELDLKLGLILGGIAFGISFIGSFLAFTVIFASSNVFPILFALFQIAVGISLIRNATKSRDVDKPRVSEKVMERIDNLPNHMKLIIVGFFACIGGLNGGFFAGPGGFLMTVILMIFFRYEIHKAVGTGILFMTLTALGPSIFYSLIAPALFPTTISFSWDTLISIRTNIYVDFNLVLIIGSFAVMGSLFSSIKAQKLSEKNLKIILGV
ncbi:MAG: sulfite exporter TauE/SafE family protein, partial [Candidatus Helarchaeota archaeon]|nr:sulfite exporter TauE/SafE family protein [Candidatus Helarchaeota archaeon]